jgi:hypothetical protein
MPDQCESVHLALQGSDDFMGRTISDAAQPFQRLDIAAFDGMGDISHRDIQRFDGF